MTLTLMTANVKLNCSMTRKYFSKRVCFSDLIYIFAMSFQSFACFLSQH